MHKRSWMVLIFASLFFFYEFMQMNIMNALHHGICTDFHISAHEFGHIAAYYADANLLFLIPAGLLLDRYSTKKIIGWAMLCCSFSTWGISIATHVVEIGVFRFLTGVAGSFCFLSCIRLASRWFVPQKLALASGVIVTLGMLGGTCAQAPMAWLVQQYGWRSALQIDAFLGLMMTFLIVWKVKDYPSGAVPPSQNSQAPSVWVGLKVAFTSRQTLLCGLYTSFLNLPIALLGAAWGVPYLEKVKSIPIQQTSMITSMLFIGTLLGGPLLGLYSDYVGKRRQLMIWGGLASLINIGCILYAPIDDVSFYMMMFFMLGFVTSAQVLSYPMIAESQPNHLTATCMSMASMLILSGYAVFQPMFGYLMDCTWKGALDAQGVRIYDAQDFFWPTMIMPIAMSFAIFLAFLMKETFIADQKKSQ